MNRYVHHLQGFGWEHESTARSGGTDLPHPKSYAALVFMLYKISL